MSRTTLPSHPHPPKIMQNPHPRTTNSSTKPPRRRPRSESDRKKHAGWRRCPRCARSVSTNGRNFYHHMHKCDRHFFADVIARIDATRSTPAPMPQPQTARLTDAQRAVFLQQLCFLRVYDRTVDAVFRKLEHAHARVCGPSVFEAVRHAKQQQAAAANHPIPDFSPTPTSQHTLYNYSAIPLPDALASPMSVPTASPSTPASIADASRTHLHSISQPIFSSPAVPGPSTLTPIHYHSPCSPQSLHPISGPVSILAPLVSIPSRAHQYFPQSPPAPHIFAQQSQQSPIYLPKQELVPISSPIPPTQPSSLHPHYPPTQQMQSPMHTMPLSGTFLPTQDIYHQVQSHLQTPSFPARTAIVTEPVSAGRSMHPQPHILQQSPARQPATTSPSSTSRPASAMSISSVINN